MAYDPLGILEGKPLEIPPTLWERGKQAITSVGRQLTRIPGPQAWGGEAKKDLGIRKKLNKDTAVKILKEAGGDKEKAREIARQRGYSF
jgi:hypothetical protein